MAGKIDSLHKKFVEETLNFLKVKNVSYGDVRLVFSQKRDIATKDGVVEAFTQNLSFGFGVRVLKNGAWGFAACALPCDFSLDKKTKKLIKDVCKKASDLASFSGKINDKKVRLKSIKICRDSYKTPVKIDPFEVSADKIIEILLRADKAQRISNKIKISQTFFSAFKTNKLFASTEGSLIDQEIIFTGVGLEATAIDQNEVQNRTYPNSFGGQFETNGFEMIEGLQLIEQAPKIAEEAVNLLKAPVCPEGYFDIIIDGNQLALQVHESCGHAVEFDRILGFEASYAGTSFIKPTDKGNLQYGSNKVNIVADATCPAGLGTFGYDDEGVAAKRQEIVKDGILVGFLTSRETTADYDLEPTGAMRATSWANLPLVRMTNINLEPGEWKLNDLIADTRKGFFLSTNKAWSIDDKRFNFQFGTEIAYEIKNGKLGKIYRNPVYASITPKFWASCDAICDKTHWKIWGTPSCGKGEPSQVVYVGHGTSPARFRNIKIFPGKIEEKNRT